MEITLNVKLDGETLATMKRLIHAMEGIAEGTPQSVDEEGPILWGNHKTGDHGAVGSKAAFDKLKAKDKDVVRLTQKQYDDLVAKEEAEEAPAKKTPAKKTPAKKTEESQGAPDRADLIDAFTTFLPKDLDTDERKERRAFVTTLLQRFGASKVSEMDEQHWELAISLVERKLAGEDVDPADADFDQMGGEDEDDDLV